MQYYQQDKECMSREELDKLQSKLLVEQVKYVYDNVPPYRQKMDAVGIKPEDIKSKEDIVKLPFSEKTDLRDNYPFGLMAVPPTKLARVHCSSGTTGKMTVVGYTAQDISDWSDIVARAFVCAGADSNSIAHIAYGYGLFTGGLGLHYGAERLGATVVPAATGNTARQIMLLRDFKADVLCCTPSYALYLAEEFRRQGIGPDEIPLKAGIFGAEPWTEEMRAQIEKELGIMALDIYGMSEIMGPGVSIECECKNGMHIWEDYFLPEVLDQKTHQPLPDGEYGELVITTLTKKGFPLIRYRTKDICKLTHEKCACGRTHVRMSKVIGRTDDMLIIRGVNVFPSQIEEVICTTEGVSPNYNIIVDRVDNKDRLEIKVELTQELSGDTIGYLENLKNNLERRLLETLGLSAKVKLVEPFNLPRSEGKAKRVIDNRKLGTITK